MKAEAVAAAPVAPPEKLPIRSVYAKVDFIGQLTKALVIEMDETNLSLQDIMDDGKLLRKAAVIREQYAART